MAAQAREVCFALEGDVPWSLICLICFIGFVSILYLIDFFFFLAEAWFWVWHIDALGVFLLGPAFFCAVR
jgi:hypothetical protein